MLFMLGIFSKSPLSSKEVGKYVFGYPKWKSKANPNADEIGK